MSGIIIPIRRIRTPKNTVGNLNSKTVSLVVSGVSLVVSGATLVVTGAIMVVTGVTLVVIGVTLELTIPTDGSYSIRSSKWGKVK